MPSAAPAELRIKPRVLIADDSRIVRATLIKHIHGMFDFREAVDGEQAWETLLIDPGIRVLITDLMMPKLDGYGLLERIRASRISRIRDLPVVVISGSDEQQERERARAAGATEMITKGIATAQLLSRLDALSQLVSSQSELERGLEALARQVPAASAPQGPVAVFVSAAAEMLAYASRHGKNFMLLHVAVELGAAATEDDSSAALDAIGELLQRTVRQTDCVARVGDAEFTLATHGIDAAAAHGFAQRICAAIRHARLPGIADGTLLAGCGVACLRDEGNAEASLDALRAAAERRARRALQSGAGGVIGAADDMADEP